MCAWCVVHGAWYITSFAVVSLQAKKNKSETDTGLWLVVAMHDTKVDLKVLATALGYGKIVLRLSTPEALLDNLGLVQGHVSPLALSRDTAQQVQGVTTSMGGCPVEY